MPGRAPAGEAVARDGTVPDIERTHCVENQTRRRVLAAGLTGTALGLLGGRVASASPDTTEPTEEGSTPPSSAAPATTTTLPPKRPSTTDLALLNYAESIELAATNLYQASIDAGAKDDLVKMLVANHRGYADLIRGILGTRSIGIPDTSLYDERLSKFQISAGKPQVRRNKRKIIYLSLVNYRG